MSRLVTAILGAFALGVALVSATPQQVFQSGTHTVSVYATVIDGDGHLVTNLQKDDFEVLDNGVRQDLTVFASDLQPITIVVMLDRSQSMESNFDLVRDGAKAFLDNLLASDKARLGSFSDRVQIDPRTFTSDRGELVRILHNNLQPPGITPLWNATGAAMTALANEPGRRVVLVFTDGYNAPDWSTMNVTFSQVRNRAQAEGVMVYAIGFSDTCEPVKGGPVWPGQPRYQGRGGPGGRIPGGGGRGPGRGPIGRFPIPRGPIGRDPFPVPRGPVGPPPTDIPRDSDDGWGRSENDGNKPCYDSKPDPDLRLLAAVSGGGYFELTGTDDLASTFERVADELHHQYLLAFAPAELDGEVHRLEVRLRRSKATVRARQSYVAMPDPVAPRTSSSSPTP